MFRVTVSATTVINRLLNFITDLINCFIFLGTLTHFFLSVAFNLLAPFLKKLAPKKGLQGPLWPSSKIFWLKHCSRTWQL